MFLSVPCLSVAHPWPQSPMMPLSLLAQCIPLQPLPLQLPVSFLTMIVCSSDLLLRLRRVSTAVLLSLWAGWNQLRPAQSSWVLLLPRAPLTSPPTSALRLVPLIHGVIIFFFYCLSLHEKQSTGKRKRKKKRLQMEYRLRNLQKGSRGYKRRRKKNPFLEEAGSCCALICSYLFLNSFQC